MRRFLIICWSIAAGAAVGAMRDIHGPAARPLSLIALAAGVLALVADFGRKLVRK